MKKKAIVFVCALVASAAIMVFAFHMDRVPNQAVAIRIATEAVELRYPGTSRFGYEVRVDTDRETNNWMVGWCPKDENILGGGGPAVIIDRRTGKVLKMFLQK